MLCIVYRVPYAASLDPSWPVPHIWPTPVEHVPDKHYIVEELNRSAHFYCSSIRKYSRYRHIMVCVSLYNIMLNVQQELSSNYWNSSTNLLKMMYKTTRS